MAGSIMAWAVMVAAMLGAVGMAMATAVTATMVMAVGATTLAVATMDMAMGMGMPWAVPTMVVHLATTALQNPPGGNQVGNHGAVQDMGELTNASDAQDPDPVLEIAVDGLTASKALMLIAGKQVHADSKPANNGKLALAFATGLCDMVHTAVCKPKECSIPVVPKCGKKRKGKKVHSDIEQVHVHTCKHMLATGKITSEVAEQMLGVANQLVANYHKLHESSVPCKYAWTGTAANMGFAQCSSNFCVLHRPEH